jgi:hypothetical protein
MTHPLRASTVLCTLALAVQTCMVYAHVIPSHIMPEAFGTLVMPSFAAAPGPCSREGDSLRTAGIIGSVVEEDRSGCAS